MWENYYFLVNDVISYCNILILFKISLVFYEVRYILCGNENVKWLRVYFFRVFIYGLFFLIDLFGFVNRFSLVVLSIID